MRSTHGCILTPHGIIRYTSAMINTTIAHYKITAKLGQGGMGEVYRATDTKLDRDVAIKILPESFAGDRNRIVRFKREAKTFATLLLRPSHWQKGHFIARFGTEYYQHCEVHPTLLFFRK